MKLKLLSIPIWLGLCLAFIFPYYGLTISSWGFTALFILSVLNTFTFNFKSSLGKKLNWRRIGFNLLIAYTLFPAIQLLLAKFLINDPSLQFGLLMASIAPIAIVVPQFLSEKSETDTAIVYILVSTLLFPVVCYFYLKALGFDRFGIHIVPLIKDAVILTFAPILLSFQFELLTPSLKEKLVANARPVTPFINMLLIGLLVFIYFGSAFAKTNFSELKPSLWAALVFIAFCQDFVPLLLLRLFKFPKTEQICFSLKNVALSGGVLLVFHPQGILACSSVLVAHSVLFTLLSEPQTFRRIFKN